MARIITFVDDMTKEAGEDVVTRTVHTDEGTLTIDLSSDSYAAMMDLLDPYIKAGNWTAKRENANDENALIRQWASKSIAAGGGGFDINKRGRIPQNVIDAYREAHKSLPAATDDTGETDPVEGAETDNGNVEASASVDA